MLKQENGKKMRNKLLERTWSVLSDKLDKHQIQLIMQFVKFGIVGLSNTIVSYVIYIVTLLLMQSRDMFMHYDYLIAQILAFALSVLWSYYWNNKYTFKSKRKSKVWIVKSLLKAYISYAFTGLFLCSFLSMLWIEKLHISKLLSPAINLVVCVPLNFLLNKFWAFNNNR